MDEFRFTRIEHQLSIINLQAIEITSEMYFLHVLVNANSSIVGEQAQYYRNVADYSHARPFTYTNFSFQSNENQYTLIVMTSFIPHLLTHNNTYTSKERNVFRTAG